MGIESTSNRLNHSLPSVVGIVLLYALSACGGGSDGGSSDGAGNLVLRDRLTTGTSGDVFDTFWNCSRSIGDPDVGQGAPSGVLLSFWSESVSTTEGASYDGGFVEKDEMADVFSWEWQPISESSLSIVSINLEQATPDDNLVLANIVFDQSTTHFTASLDGSSTIADSDLDCILQDSGAAAFCQFYGSFKPVCGS